MMSSHSQQDTSFPIPDTRILPQHQLVSTISLFEQQVFDTARFATQSEVDGLYFLHRLDRATQQRY